MASKTQKTLRNNKLTKKNYISKYIFLKILFGDFKINDFVFSESQMSKHFKTTNTTVRTAYNNLIQRGILKSIKGKGYIVLKNIASYLFDQYENLQSLEMKKKGNTFAYFQNKKKIISLTYETRKDINEPNHLLNLFKEVFNDLSIDEIILKKTYLSQKKHLINKYNYVWNDQIILAIELKIDWKYINLFNYQKHLNLN